MNSCDDGLVKWDSVKSIPDTFDNVPQDQKFKMILTSKGMEVERLSYTLRKGRTLENKDKTCKFLIEGEYESLILISPVVGSKYLIVFTETMSKSCSWPKNPFHPCPCTQI